MYSPLNVLDLRERANNAFAHSICVASEKFTKNRSNRSKRNLINYTRLAVKEQGFRHRVPHILSANSITFWPTF